MLQASAVGQLSDNRKTKGWIYGMLRTFMWEAKIELHLTARPGSSLSHILFMPVTASWKLSRPQAHCTVPAPNTRAPLLALYLCCAGTKTTKHTLQSRALLKSFLSLLLAICEPHLSAWLVGNATQHASHIAPSYKVKWCVALPESKQAP